MIDTTCNESGESFPVSVPSTGKRPTFDVEQVVREATVSEKVALLSGKDFWHTQPVERLGVPSIRLTDGPNGARGTRFFNGVPAACLPCGTSLASTWNPEILYQAGELLGKECKAKGAHCWLGPTINVQRSPLGGRGFESFSEDPYLSGKLSGSYINGTQSTGVIATVKHFVANDQEHERMAVNVQVNSRALREIYMLPFQIAIAESSPGAVMTCYNKVNGIHVSESRDLLNDVLRGEWRWKGLIMSDWFGTYSTSEALNAGLDLEMPGATRWRGVIADLAVSSRKVTSETLDDRARNVLNFVHRASQIDGVSPVEGMRDFPEDQALNRRLASEGMVLMKNDKNILPLPVEIKEIALIGPSLKHTAFCGGGSASLTPYYAISPYQGIVNQLRKDVKIHYEVGAYGHGMLPTLGEHLTTPDGLPGMRMRFFQEPPSVKNREVIDEAICPDTYWQLMGYSHPRLEKIFYADCEGIYISPATGKIEFGIAAHGTSSLFIDGKLIIDNTTTQRPGHAFFGKGTAEEVAVVEMERGKSYRIKLEFGSVPTSKIVKPGVVSYGGGAGCIGAAPVLDQDKAILRAVELAKNHKYTVLCAGLNKEWESEGFDRLNMDLPGRVSELIAAVVAANPDTVIVTQSGTPITMEPWISKASTHVHMWYGGNETGNGLADVLFGKVNPSAKLPLSFPKRLEDNPAFLNFESERGRVVYGESIYVGYRYYEKVQREVLYPFGHGLSYTTFSFSHLKIFSDRVTLIVKNTGSRAGAEVVQLYIAANPNTSSISRPKKELKGFYKVFLEPGAQKEVEIPLDRFATAFWDEILNKWVNEKGTYKVLIGKSSADIILEGTLVMTGTKTWTGL